MSGKVATWGKRLVHGDWYRKECSAPATQISDGWYVRYEEVGRYDTRSPFGRSRGFVKNYIDWLVNCTATGGNLEPAIWVAPDSYLETVATTLRQMGDWLKENGEAVITIKCKVDFTFTGKWHGNLDEDGPKDIEILKGFGGIDAKAPGKVRIKGKTFDNLHFHGESEGAGGEYKVQFKPN